jgi:hypothetical protein
MTNCLYCDREIVVELIQIEQGIFAFGSVTLHDSISFDELGLIKSLAIDTAKTMTNGSMKWLKFPCDEFPMYKVCIILTAGK